jgi:hypothetical protein
MTHHTTTVAEPPRALNRHQRRALKAMRRKRAA